MSSSNTRFARVSWALTWAVLAGAACSGGESLWAVPDGAPAPTDIGRRMSAVVGPSCEGSRDNPCAPTRDGTARAIPGSYLFKLAAGANPATLRDCLARAGGENIEFLPLFHGYFAHLPLERETAALRDVSHAHCGTAWYESNRTAPPQGVHPTCGGDSQRGLDALDGHVDGFYAYPPPVPGAQVYLMDTTVFPDAEVNWQDGYSPFERPDAPGVGRVGPWIDEARTSANQHGTVAARLIGGRRSGVAKGVAIHPVAVLSDALGSTSASGVAAVIRGLNWVVGRIASGSHDTRPIVLMNFAVESRALREALRCATGEFCSDAADEAGVAGGGLAGAILVAPAGNYGVGDDRCLLTPAGYERVVAVGALNTRAPCAGAMGCAVWPVESYSDAAEFWAPGSGWVADAPPHGPLHGTSAAAAYAAGLIALDREALDPAMSSRLVAEAHRGACSADAGIPTRAAISFARAVSPASDNFTGDTGGPLDKDGVRDGLQPSEGEFETCPAGGRLGGILCPEGGDCVACGELGRTCCSGSRCSSSWSCAGGRCAGGGTDQRCLAGGRCSAPRHNCELPGTPASGGHGTCRPCGGRGQTACAEGSPCDAGLTIDPSGQCAPCGDPGELCCYGTGCAGESTICVGTMCEQCGHDRERCCGTTCGEGLNCGGGRCAQCGGPDQSCCERGRSCRGGDRICTDSECRHCGGRDERCCEGGACAGNDVCTSGFCRERCGGPGERCCSAGARCTGELRCQASDNLCHPCGGSGEQCCISGEQCRNHQTCADDFCRVCCARCQDAPGTWLRTGAEVGCDGSGSTFCRDRGGLVTGSNPVQWMSPDACRR